MTDARVGKVIDLDVEAADATEAKEKVEKMCEQLLANPLIERFEQFLEFIQRIDSPWVGLNFDIGHAYCVGEDPQDWVAKMAAHTRHYHLEDIAITRVHFHHRTPAEMRRYLARIQPLDKAGAYAIQEHGDKIVESISGSLTNVIGLPVEVGFEPGPGGQAIPSFVATGPVGA